MKFYIRNEIDDSFNPFYFIVYLLFDIEFTIISSCIIFLTYKLLKLKNRNLVFIQEVGKSDQIKIDLSRKSNSNNSCATVNLNKNVSSLSSIPIPSSNKKRRSFINTNTFLKKIIVSINHNLKIQMNQINLTLIIKILTLKIERE